MTDLPRPRIGDRVSFLSADGAPGRGQVASYWGPDDGWHLLLSCNGLGWTVVSWRDVVAVRGARQRAETMEAVI